MARDSRRQPSAPGPAGDLQPGDRWVDPAGDHWLAVLTDDGPRLRLCDGDGPPPARSASRPLDYVLREYGPLRLLQRDGSYAVPPTSISVSADWGPQKGRTW